MTDCPKAIGRPRWCACHGWEHETTEQHKCDWGPWHPWCSTYRCIHPGCHKNMPSAEVAKRLNEYETQNNINADLLEACVKARIFIEYAIYELKDGKAKFGDQFPHKEDGHIIMNRLDEAIRKAKEKQEEKS